MEKRNRPIESAWVTIKPRTPLWLWCPGSYTTIASETGVFGLKKSTVRSNSNTRPSISRPSSFSRMDSSISKASGSESIAEINVPTVLICRTRLGNSTCSIRSRGVSMSNLLSLAVAKVKPCNPARVTIS